MFQAHLPAEAVFKAYVSVSRKQQLPASAAPFRAGETTRSARGRGLRGRFFVFFAGLQEPAESSLVLLLVLSLSSICSRVMQAAMCALATIVWSMSSGSNYLSEAESAICTCCRLPASREYQFARSSTWLFPVCQPTKLQFWVRAHKILPSRLTITAQLLVDAWLLTPRSSSSYFMWM